MWGCYTLILHPSTYCQHGGIYVISSIVGGSSSKSQVVSRVCFGDVKIYTVCYSYCFPTTASQRNDLTALYKNQFAMRVCYLHWHCIIMEKLWLLIIKEELTWVFVLVSVPLCNHTLLGKSTVLTHWLFAHWFNELYKSVVKSCCKSWWSKFIDLFVALHKTLHEVYVNLINAYYV